MTIITPELRQAIDLAGNEPARIIDTETNTTYLVVRELDFAVIPVGRSGEISPGEQDGVLQEAGRSIGWDDRLDRVA